MARYNVREVACDPAYWREQIALWIDIGIPAIDWPTTSVARMVPACRQLYNAVVERRLTHDGDAALTRHVANAVVKEDQLGAASSSMLVVRRSTSPWRP